jgi:Spy/CpxP family protein refolding chaperone
MPTASSLSKGISKVIMSKFAFVKTAIAAGGLLFLCAAPELALGQSSQPGAASPAPMKPASAPHGKSAAPPDLLEGLTLADDQKAKIGQIREETKSRLAAMDSDKTLSPEAADAMRRGYQRLESGKILEVLTLEQQQQVRKRIAALRAATGKPQYPLRQVPVSK